MHAAPHVTRLLQMTGVVVDILQKVERLPVSGQGLTVIVVAKTLAHWLVSGADKATAP